MSISSAPQEAFKPGCATTWIARGRKPEHAEALARAWRHFPDLPASRPLEERMARTRERVTAMRPVYDAMSVETEAQRRAQNFAFMESQARAGRIGDRDLAILQGRDRHGFDWDDAVRYADGWYAAHAGWSYAPRRTGQGRQAYDQGFADGGGDRTDLFDAARRQLLADTRVDNLPPPAVTTASARPLPSSWPLPADDARPSRWSRRLLILTEAELAGWPTRAGKRSAAPLGMLHDYAGAADMTVVILTRHRGFVARDAVTPATTTGRCDIASMLRSLLSGREFDDILVTAQGEYLDMLDKITASIPLCRSMERTRNTPLQQRAHFRIWLDRGWSGEGNRGAGHIRWGKVTKGLTGKLGEFTTRYGGRGADRRHRILVELTGGTPATGFVSATGARLEPEILFGNKADMRRHMASALRAFAGATRLVMQG